MITRLPFPFRAPAMLLAALLACSVSINAQVPAPLPPTVVDGLAYTNAFFPGAAYDAAIPGPESILGFALGDRAATAGEIERALKAWAAAAPDRTRLVEYARSHEGRPLHYLVITSPRNRARLDDIQAGLARLADPRQIDEAAAASLADSLPAVAWLAYCIHGDETEGADAALAILHHLLADRRTETARLLDDLVIVVDPLQNPDGRDRFLKMVAEHRGASPNVDAQSLLHSGYWPRGRVNHYLFDLNRDWILATQPETRGRLREVARWNPQLFVDVHGMTGEDTYLFSPPREPMNGHMPANRGPWGRVFARDQARAFDANGWIYYTGEWNEGWYPGYSDAWSVFRGAVGILYEVASIGQDGVRRADGRIQSQRESIHQHIVSSMANLATLQTHARTRVREFAAERRANLAADGPYARRTWAVPPTANRSRLAAFIDTLRVQGVELHQLDQPLTVTQAIDQLGRSLTNLVLPSGTVLVANRQPAAPLVAALLEFDPRLSESALDEERRELLRTGETTIYDITAWNLTLLHGLEAVTLPQDLPVGARPITALPPVPPPPVVTRPAAWVVDGADDASVTLAARLMERGVAVRAAEKPFQFDGRDFARGSVVVLPIDNRRFVGDLAAAVQQGAAELGLAAVAVATGLGEDELPDLGGRYFRQLQPPRIAVVGRGRVQPNDFGTIWFLLDQQLGLRHSHLTDGDGPPDFTRYNVVVLPDRGGSLPGSWRESLKRWVESGGTLIAIEGAAGDLVSRTNELTRVRALPDVLGRLPDYERMIFREWLAQNGPRPGGEELWTRVVTGTGKSPWPAGGEPAKEEELKKRDAWNRLFMPQGALLAARVDPRHWLTFGTGPILPVLAGNQPVLMAEGGVESPVRFGVLMPAPRGSESEKPAGSPDKASPPDVDKDKDKATRKEGDGKEKPVRRAGWSALPEGHELQLRLSGLLWPEAGQRFANSAAVTREGLGRGQVILFAGAPNFRASSRGTARLLANALIYGPGFGTTPTVRP